MVVYMANENRKELISAIHKEQIMKAAEQLFLTKGYRQTTIDDISAASSYSRRTIYAYFLNKEDLLYQIVEKGLHLLKDEIEQALYNNQDFFITYQNICKAMNRYQKECPISMEQVNHSQPIHTSESASMMHIYELGNEINQLLVHFLELGQQQGIVRKDMIPLLSVYILWSSISSLLTLVQTKGNYITKACSISEEELLDYGYNQILNSILETKRS